MGCSSSTHFHINDKHQGQNKAAYDDFKKIELSDSSIQLFYKVFVKFSNDFDHDHLIELDEFLDKLKLSDHNKMAREVFSDMDTDNSGDLNFREFVLCTWKYLTRSKESIAVFAFDLFDKDNSGSLAREEVKDMIEFVYGKKGLIDNVQRVLKDLDKSGDGKISREEFVTASMKFPALLFPAFELQGVLRDNVLGGDFWNSQLRNADRILAKPQVQELFSRRKKVATATAATAASGQGNTQRIKPAARHSVSAKKANVVEEESSSSGSDSGSSDDDDDDEDDATEKARQAKRGAAMKKKTKTAAKASAAGQRRQGGASEEFSKIRPKRKQKPATTKPQKKLQPADSYDED